MNTSGIELREALARDVTVGGDSLTVDLSDGRTITVPLAWFPRLEHGSPAARANWRFIAGGEGIHWPDLDEDVSIQSLLSGRKSAETQESLRRWLQRASPGHRTEAERPVLDTAPEPTSKKSLSSDARGRIAAAQKKRWDKPAKPAKPTT